MASSVSSLLRTFGIPVPEVPQQLADMTAAVIDGLGGDNGYACINSAAQAAAGGGDTGSEQLSRFQQREFEAFLKTHDPEVSSAFFSLPSKLWQLGHSLSENGCPAGNMEESSRAGGAEVCKRASALGLAGSA